MGQQQLLLLALAVLIVSIAVVVGINRFSTGSSSSNRDAVVSDLVILGSAAQQYYRKAGSLGGGGNSFTGWTIPTQSDSTGNGTYEATSVTDQAVTLVGTGNQTGNDGTNPVKVTMVIGPNSIVSTVTNN
ncbi:MAG: hypothetical protein M1391_07370 [Bacteroidetes bacterium]|nr:hypothetical protein [Bacteroidota bacterium]